MDNIDKAAESFQAWLKQAKKKLATIYVKAYKGKAVVDMAQVDLTAVLLDKLGGRKAIQQLLSVQVKVAKSKYPKLGVDVLTALMGMSKKVYLGKIGATGAEIQQLLVTSAAQGLSEASVIAALETTGLTEAQAGSLANDSIRRFQRQVMLEHSKILPKDQLYAYEGPSDDRTSPQCREMMDAGALTLDEINSRFPGSFVAGGHVNCRHAWVPV